MKITESLEIDEIYEFCKKLDYPEYYNIFKSLLIHFFFSILFNLIVKNNKEIAKTFKI